MTNPAIIPFDARAEVSPWPDFSDSLIAAGARQHGGRLWLNDRKLGVAAGVWEAGASLGRWTVWPVHEFFMVLSGEVVLVEEGGETVVRAGESAVIPKGCRCIWNQCGPVRKYMVAFEDREAAAAEEKPRIVRIDPQVTLAPSTPPPPAMLHSEVPEQNAHEFFTSPTGQMAVGIWDTTGYHRKLIDFPRHELMHLLEGKVTFRGGDGRFQSYEAGDTFFVPLGTPNAWQSEGYLRKIYCIIHPAPPAA